MYSLWFCTLIGMWFFCAICAYLDYKNASHLGKSRFVKELKFAMRFTLVVVTAAFIVMKLTVYFSDQGGA